MANFDDRRSILTAAGVVVALTAVTATDSFACDDFATRLITKSIKSQIESLDCGALGRAGLDKRDHHLKSVCYSSTGSQSRIEIVADLSCRTSGAAVFHAQVSDTVSARATVNGNCEIQGVEVQAAGDVGKTLLRAFDANGAARKALQEALKNAC